MPGYGVKEPDEFGETDEARRPGIVDIVEKLQKAASVQEKYLFEHREVIAGVLKPDMVLAMKDPEPSKNIPAEPPIKESSPLRDQLEALLEQIHRNSHTLTHMTGRVDN